MHKNDKNSSKKEELSAKYYIEWIKLNDDDD